MTGRAKRGTADSLIGSVQSLGGLVGYQEASIVSRTLFDSKAATVTLFAFDEGQGLSEHTTPFEAMVYVVEGEAGVAISGAAHRVRRGEMLILPAGEPHEVQAASKFKMLLVMVRS